MARLVAVCDYVSFDGCDSRDPCLHFGKGTGVAGVADPADAAHLPANAELLHLEGDLARNQRGVGELGEIGAHGVGCSANLIDHFSARPRSTVSEYGGNSHRFDASTWNCVGGRLRI